MTAKKSMTTKKQTATKKPATKKVGAQKAANTVSYRPNFVTFIVSLLAGAGLGLLCLFVYVS